MDKAEMVALAMKTAEQYGLNGALICALCEQESSWQPNATRYEPAFYERYIVPLIEPEQLSDGEAKGRATSWGLCQVLGQVAREHGYTGPFQQMCDDPATGIDLGCKVFASKLKAAGGDTYEGLLRYNGGGNDRYPEQVINRIPHYLESGGAVSSDVESGDL